MHIAILDDNPCINDFLVTALKLAGHTASSYTTSTSFLDAARAAYNSGTERSLLLIDLCLPGSLSGVDVIHAIRSFAPSQMLPIILMTGASDARIQQIRRDLPSLPIFQKPFPVASLLQHIEQIRQSVAPSISVSTDPEYSSKRIDGDLEH